MSRLVVRSERVVLPSGVHAAAVFIEDGRFTRVGECGEISSGAQELDAGDLVVMPGLVDTHVHMNEPGRTDWEGFASGTRAAAAGGVTTIVDMPLNAIPPTTTVAGLRAKQQAAAGQCHVDVAFWGGVVPGNAADLEPLAAAGVRGFKCFLAPSGVEEFPHVGEADLREAMPVLARLGLPLLAHAELPPLLREPEGDPRSYAGWLHSRPGDAEDAAIGMLLRFSHEFHARVHIVHLATADAVPMVRTARAAGSLLTVETCPHYLSFAAEEIAVGATAFKCAPPIRERRHREALWEALVDGHIDLVATDHSPAPPSLKAVDDGDFVRAWGGIASLQLGLAAVWTGASWRGIGLEHLAKWMCEAPARLAGLDNSKGRIAAGADADLVIWNPDAEFTVDGGALRHRHPLTPYHGMRLRGVVQTTILRGTVIYHDGEVMPEASGKVIASDR